MVWFLIDDVDRAISFKEKFEAEESQRETQSENYKAAWKLLKLSLGNVQTLVRRLRKAPAVVPD